MITYVPAIDAICCAVSNDASACWEVSGGGPELTLFGAGLVVVTVVGDVMTELAVVVAECGIDEPDAGASPNQ